MIKLPILETPVQNTPCCTANFGRTAYYAHNLPDFPENGIRCITSALTGGDFTQYLLDAKNSTAEICLILQPLHHVFTMPSFDGCGSRFDEQDMQTSSILNKGEYSRQLMCLYYYDSCAKKMYLLDTEETLSQKVNAAHLADFPYLAAETDIIKKLRLPE